MADWKPNRTKAELMAGIPDVKRSRKMQGRSTVQYETLDGATHIKYHDTVVLTTLKNGTVRLNSGGFRTVTTKERINQYQNVIRLWQNKGEWFCGLSWRDEGIPFFDGISFTKKGRLIGEKRAESKARSEKKRIKKAIGQINEYCAALKIEVDAGRVPRPKAGDCFICRVPMFPLSCIQSHLDERYVHGTLVYNALKWAGYQEHQLTLWYRMGCFHSVVSTVRRYLRYQMGVA